MLAMSPLCPSFGWDYPLELGTQQQSLNLDNWNLDSIILPNNFPTFQPENNNCDYVNHDVKRSDESRGSANSSSDNYLCGDYVLSKKLNHNASERDRRKKINNLYSTLRDLLPSNDHSKKLSIPMTVGRVLKYIPELQKQMDDLIHKKDELLSKLSMLKGSTTKVIEEEKPIIKNTLLKNKNSCSIFACKLRENEIIIQISTLESISLHEVLLKLEMDGFLLLNVSSFRSFGGSTSYNIHFWIEGANSIKCEKLSQELLYFLRRENVNQIYY